MYSNQPEKTETLSSSRRYLCAVLYNTETLPSGAKVACNVFQKIEFPQLKIPPGWYRSAASLGLASRLPVGLGAWEHEGHIKVMCLLYVCNEAPVSMAGVLILCNWGSLTFQQEGNDLRLSQCLAGQPHHHTSNMW